VFGEANPLARHARIANEDAAPGRPRDHSDTALQKHWPCMLISRQVVHHNSAMPVAAVEPIVYAD
jgi:hypothetical protein